MSWQKKVYYPLIDGEFASANASTMVSAGYCLEGSLDPKKVKGKIVFCRRGGNNGLKKGLVVKSPGGAGMILANDALHRDSTMADPRFLLASRISLKDGLAVQAYIKEIKNQSAYITNVKIELGVKPAPSMASSSRSEIIA